MPRCDTEAMNLHLAEIATQIAPGAHAALLVDQAGWHLSGRLTVPPNITLIPLPAKCPELNPQENVWQFMRDNWLSNRIFKSYDQIVDHCCDAWNKLIGNYPPPPHGGRFCDERAAQARMLTITLNGLAPWSRAVSIAVRTSASASAAHMAR